MNITDNKIIVIMIIQTKHKKKKIFTTFFRKKIQDFDKKIERKNFLKISHV